MKKQIIAVIAGIMGFASTAMSNAMAQDENLYAKEPPATAGFVRFINATGADLGEITIGKKTVEFDEDMTTDYLVLEGKEYDWAVGDISGNQTVAAKTFYTIALTDGEDGVTAKAYTDETSGDPAKCAIFVYNLTATPDVDLHAKSVNADIVADIPAFASASRDVNALTVDLELRQGGKVIAEYPKTAFQRKTGVSYILVAGADAPTAIVVKNTIERLE
ncbi:MAG: alginate O-acetyltransferase AlgF [bacterium]